MTRRVSVGASASSRSLPAAVFDGLSAAEEFVVLGVAAVVGSEVATVAEVYERLAAGIRRHPMAMVVWTIGHGTRPVEELVSIVRAAGVCTLVDVRRFPGSRHNPQFNGPALRAVLEENGVAYRHAVELGGRRSGEAGEDRFDCLRVAAFRSYAARMGSEGWQAALATALAEPAVCLMCSETLWWRCHRRLIAELLHARGERVVHLLGPGKQQEHRLLPEAAARESRLYLCGALVA